MDGCGGVICQGNHLMDFRFAFPSMLPVTGINWRVQPKPKATNVLCPHYSKECQSKCSEFQN